MGFLDAVLMRYEKRMQKRIDVAERVATEMIKQENRRRVQAASQDQEGQPSLIDAQMSRFDALTGGSDQEPTTQQQEQRQAEHEEFVRRLNNTAVQILNGQRPETE